MGMKLLVKLEKRGAGATVDGRIYRRKLSPDRSRTFYPSVNQ